MQEAGIVAVSDDGKPIATARLMRQVMEYCGPLGLPVIDHCEDLSLFAGGAMREGPRSLRLGLNGIPAAVRIDLRWARCGSRTLAERGLHIAHLSTAASLDHVRRAKKRGLNVTCEVTPHHFTMTDEDVRVRFETTR